MIAIGNHDGKIKIHRFAKNEDGTIDSEKTQDEKPPLIVPRPYQDTNVIGVKGLNPTQIELMKTLGAIENEK